MGTKEQKEQNNQNGEQTVTNDKFYSAGNDTVFKKLFVDNPDLLKQFIADVLNIPVEEIEELVIKNPELPPANATGKMCRLDIYAVAGGRKLNIEMQAKRFDDFEDRSLYYWACIYVKDIEQGTDYGDVPKTIAVNILDFTMFPWKQYRSCFTIMENKEHVRLTDKLEMHFFELPKLSNKRLPRGKGELWLRMLKAKSKEELNVLKTKKNPYINKGIDQIMLMNSDEKFKEYMREHENWERDYRSSMSYAKKQGMEQGRELGRTEGMELGSMQKLTELVKRKLSRGKSPEVIAEELDEELSVVQEVIKKLQEEQA